MTDTTKITTGITWFALTFVFGGGGGGGGGGACKLFDNLYTYLAEVKTR